ncbi:phage tail tape measure protein [Paenibacillus macerans]|uniref:phage tail tape measure protein n=1 Tax=Paenibacillus macerans TaxID=44252 RepID=UPI003D318F41
MAGNGIIGNLMFAVGFKVADSALKKAEKQTESLKKSWEKVGIAAGIIGTAMAGIGFAAVNAATDFNNSMSSIQTATGMTAAQMEQTRSIAEDLYNQNFGENWNDLGSAIAATAQVTNEQGKALEKTTRNALLLRDSMGFEVPESVKTANTLMKQFGVTSDQAFSLIAQGKQKGLDFSGEMLDSINEYANQFKSLGFDANQMFDTLAIGAQNGAFNLDKVGDAVKEFNIRAKDGSQTTVQAFEMLGLNSDKMMQTFARGGPEAKKSFTQIVQMISDIEDPVQQNTVAVNLFGTQFEDLEKNVIFAMGNVQNQFDMTQNKMEELNQTKFSTPGEAAARIGRQLETNLLIPIGQELMPYLNQFSQWLTIAGPEIQKFSGALVNGLAAGIGAVNSGLDFLINNIDVIGPALAGFAVVIGIKLIPVIKAFVQAQWAAARAGWAAVAPWLPVIGIAVAIGLAIAGIILIIKNWGTIGPWLANIWNRTWTWIKNAFNAGLQFVRTWGPVFLIVLSGPIGWIVALIVKYWDQIQTFTRNVFNGILSFFVGIWARIVNSVSSAGSNIWSKITGVWNRVTSFLQGINLFTIGKNIIEGLINGIGSMANAVVDKVKDIGNSITDKVKGILGIHSPSRVMMELGFYTGEGLAQGIAGTQSRVEGASENLAGGAEAAVQSTSPALPPARAGGGNMVNVEITVPISVQGNATPAVVQNLREAVNNELYEIIMSALRRAGLEGA